MATTYGPYTPVRSGGNLLFVSGQIGIDPATKKALEGIAEQTKQTLQNMQQALQDMGAEMEDVVKTTIFLTDMGDFSAMNAVYEQAFPTPRPARSTVGVRELPRVGGDTTLLVEIEAIAYREFV
jgi:2-iminobutanoate/2-iminopropanoate deaminase